MAYGNRTDLNSPAEKVAKTVVPGQTYGQGAEQMRAQEAVPMGQAPSEAAPRVVPGAAGAFDRPTDRPQEPITAGVNFGPGLNAAQAGVARPLRTEDPVLDRLQQLHDLYPNEDLADLLDSYIRDGY